MDLFTTSSPGGLPTLSLTTNSSWLPWGKVAISPLMPVPQLFQIYPSIRVHQRQCNFRKRNQVIWIVAPLRDALQWLLVLAKDDDGYVIQYNTITTTTTAAAFGFCLTGLFFWRSLQVRSHPPEVSKKNLWELSM